MSERSIQDRWEQGDPYEQYVGRWSRRVAPAFLDWMGCPPGLHWLDTGCGTGALSAAILAYCAPSRVTCVEPSPGFLRAARKNLAGQAWFTHGTAAAIPLASAVADVLVSGLMLNFTPDPVAAVKEMARVVKDKGVVAAYVWDYAGKMELIRFFWDSVRKLDPKSEQLDEGRRFPLCQPEELRKCFRSAGLKRIEGTAVDIPTNFASFDAYWEPFLGGQGPGPAYVAALDEVSKTRLREDLRGRIPAGADGSITLIARAWAVRGLAVKE